MAPAQFDFHAHIREPIHFQLGDIHYLALEIEASFIRTRRHAQQLPERLIAHYLDALFAVRAQADKFVYRNGVLTGHRIGNLAAYPAPTVRAGKHLAQALGKTELERAVRLIVIIRIGKFEQMGFPSCVVCRSAARYI